MSKGTETKGPSLVFYYSFSYTRKCQGADEYFLNAETGGRKQKDRPLSPSSRSLTLATVSHSRSIFDFPEYAKQRRISALVSSSRISRVRRGKRVAWNMQPDTVP